MEENLVRLLADTQSSLEGPRKQAEQQLSTLYPQPGFGKALASIASHQSLPTNVRQSALLSLKLWVQAGWSYVYEQFQGQIWPNDQEKAELRQSLLALAMSGQEERKIRKAAGYVVSKIASADFPEDWPDLLPTVINVVQTGQDEQLQGALAVLVELVDDCFNDEQFFGIAVDLVKALYSVTTNDIHRPIIKALAVSVFRSCFDILEMVMEDHKAAVKSFADETLGLWIPLFVQMMQQPIPRPPSEEEENGKTPAAETYRGLIALKLQIVKALGRIRAVFPSNLAPHSVALFSATWAELSSLQDDYQRLYIDDQRQSRMEDENNLPYTLDFLVLEELDFLQTCLRAQPVRKELEGQLGTENNWVAQVMKLAVGYAQITTEEEGMWNIDVNVFLSEETSVTANYTPRTACGDLVCKLGEWKRKETSEGLLAYTSSLYATNQSWKAKEAALFILNHLLLDIQDLHTTSGVDFAAAGFVDFVQHAIQQDDEFLKARGYLVAGSLSRTPENALGRMTGQFMQMTINTINADTSDVVKVSCIRALQSYLQAVTPDVAMPLQSTIISALNTYISTQDLEDFTGGENDDLMVTLVETLRDAILLDTSICLTGGGLDLLFSIASRGAGNFNVTMLVNETFDEVAGTIAATGPNQYAQLCAKVLPSLAGAFDVGALTEENALVNLAAELLANLTLHGPEPLPQGLVATAMPKLHRILLNATDDELLKSATTAVKNILMHDSKQLFEWQDEAGKNGLEVVLVVVDRLLGPTVDDSAAEEVGGLAAELVEKAGSERLGPYLVQLLNAVAVRLSNATQAGFIQSLILVFARLSLINAREVVDFLAQLHIGTEDGLQVVMSKWLENSVNFAGWDEIRQK